MFFILADILIAFIFVIFLFAVTEYSAPSVKGGKVCHDSQFVEVSVYNLLAPRQVSMTEREHRAERQKVGNSKQVTHNNPLSVLYILSYIYSLREGALVALVLALHL